MNKSKAYTIGCVVVIGLMLVGLIAFYDSDHKIYPVAREAFLMGSVYSVSILDNNMYVLQAGDDITFYEPDSSSSFNAWSPVELSNPSIGLDVQNSAIAAYTVSKRRDHVSVLFRSGKLFVWNVADQLHSIVDISDRPLFGTFSALEYSPDGKSVAIGSGLSEDILIYDAMDGKLLKSLERPKESWQAYAKTDIVYSTTGQYLFMSIGGKDAVSNGSLSTLDIFEMPSGHHLQHLRYPNVKLMKIICVGKNDCIVGTDNETTLMMWRHLEQQEYVLDQTHSGEFRDVLGVPERDEFYTIEDGQTALRLRNLQFDVRYTISELRRSITAIGIDEKNKLLAVGFDALGRNAIDPQYVKLFSINTGAPLPQKLIATGGIYSVAISNHNGLVVAGVSPKACDVWDARKVTGVKNNDGRELHP